MCISKPDKIFINVKMRVIVIFQLIIITLYKCRSVCAYFLVPKSKLCNQEYTKPNGKTLKTCVALGWSERMTTRFRLDIKEVKRHRYTLTLQFLALSLYFLLPVVKLILFALSMRPEVLDLHLTGLYSARKKRKHKKNNNYLPNYW